MASNVTVLMLLYLDKCEGEVFPILLPQQEMLLLEAPMLPQVVFPLPQG